MELPTILVPLDGSELAERAIPPALGLAKVMGASLLLAHVHQHSFGSDHGESLPPGADVTRLRDRERSYLEGVANRLRGTRSARVETLHLEGSVVQALLEAAREREAQAIVMATHGYSGLAHAWVGSVADEMVRRCTVPLMLIRPSKEPASTAVPVISKILIPLDGSSLAEQILPVASSIAAAAGADIVLIRVVEPVSVADSWVALPSSEQGRVAARLVEKKVVDAREYLETVAKQLRTTIPNVKTEVLVAPQRAVAVLDYSDRLGVSLIALCTHGYGGVAELLLGSMADKVLRGSSIPVLFSRPRVDVLHHPPKKHSVSLDREAIKLK